MPGDLAQLRIELDDIRSDVSWIKRWLDLMEAGSPCYLPPLTHIGVAAIGRPCPGLVVV